LHNFLLGIDLFICGLVTVLIIYICWRFRASKNPVPYRTTHNTPLEVTWTVIPAVLLMFIAIRSFPILLEYDTIPDADITVKVTGRQWYWDYAYPDNGGLQFSSNIVPSDALPADQRALRLLAVDNEVVLPTNTNIRIQITAGDVVHSWAVPALGVKRDAIPGRLNEVWTRIEREGIYYGQCSELCGRNHALMPIAVRAVSRERFDQWLAEAKQKFALVTNLRDPQ
jgi:cytochrome c oxidase subunit 2